MMEIIVLCVMMIVTALAALRWGSDSRDEIDSQEWVKRRAWKAFH
ncbi:MAG TPA: hypothetical protein VFA09_02115 [Ktedonobacteraceae bacterium]|jgi:hypothetical protein|nr:hypothetical protein [Ktedonobacteraceae bacterium]